MVWRLILRHYDASRPLHVESTPKKRYISPPPPLHYYDVEWRLTRLCLFNTLSMPPTKRTPTLRITGPLWGQSTGDLSIPVTNGQWNKRRVFPWLVNSWQTARRATEKIWRIYSLPADHSVSAMVNFHYKNDGWYSISEQVLVFSRCFR